MCYSGVSVVTVASWIEVLYIYLNKRKENSFTLSQAHFIDIL